MKKTSVLAVLALALTVFFGSIASQVRAEAMNFKLISMVEKLETVQVSGVEKVALGVLDRKGLSVFEMVKSQPQNVGVYLIRKKDFRDILP